MAEAPPNFQLSAHSPLAIVRPTVAPLICKSYRGPTEAFVRDSQMSSMPITSRQAPVHGSMTRFRICYINIAVLACEISSDGSAQTLQPVARHFALFAGYTAL